jgi:TctA family transporter
MPGVSGQLKLLLPHKWNLIRGTLVGFVIGIVPGTGATIMGVLQANGRRAANESPPASGWKHVIGSCQAVFA